MVGLAGFEPAASAPRTPRATSCATTRCHSPFERRALGREGTIPHLLVQSQVCYRLHYSRMCRAPPETRTPIRGVRTRSVPVTAEARGAGGESRTLNGPSPPGSEPGASSCSATPACDAENGLDAVDPNGLEPSPDSVQRSCTAARALGPWSAGQESNLQCPKAPGLRPGAVPRRRPAAGPGVSRRGIARPRSAYWRSLQFSRSDLGATGSAHIEIWARRASRGAGNRTPTMTVLEAVRLPAPHPSGVFFIVFRPEIQKSRLLSEAAPKRSSDL